jgi:hypothetical protein
MEKTYTREELDAAVFEALTIQLLRLRNEFYEGGGMSKEDFTIQHFGREFSDYERALADREGISLA